MKQILIILFIVPAFCFGQIPDPLPNTYINDLANVLTPAQEQSINERIYAIEKKSSVQIAVILLSELPGDMDIADYAMQVGRKWHVGNARNGLVYVAAINQRKQRLEVAGNLEGDIADVTAMRIIDNIKPYFRVQDYYGGVNKLLDGIDERVDPIKKEQLKLLQAEQDKKDEQFKESALNVLLWLFIIAITCIIAWVSYFRPRRRKRQMEEEMNDRKNDLSLSGLTGAGGIPTMMAATAGLSMCSVRRKKKLFQQPEYKSDDINKLTKKNDDDDYTPPPSFYSGNSGSSGSGSSSNDNSSSYGNWGSGSSDSGSSGDSGFSGAGSSGEW